MGRAPPRRPSCWHNLTPPARPAPEPRPTRKFQTAGYPAASGPSLFNALFGRRTLPPCEMGRRQDLFLAALDSSFPGLAIGKMTEKAAPLGALAETNTLPPWASTSLFTIESPRP